MQWKNTLIVSLALILLAVVAAPILDAQADAHNGAAQDAHHAPCPHCSGPVFPPTEEADVARAYATAHIVSSYLKNRPATNTDAIVNFTAKVHDAMD